MRGRANGFTLIELMLVITIILLMAGVAVPLLTQMAGSSKTDNAAAQVQAMIQMARQQAVQYHVETSVLFLPPNTGTTNHPYTRMILGQNTTPGGTFQVMPGTYTVDLPNGIQVATLAAGSPGYAALGSTPAGPFGIAFSTAGTVHPRTNSSNLVLEIGPVGNTESTEKTVEYRLNRVTGAFLQLTDREMVKTQ